MLLLGGTMYSPGLTTSPSMRTRLFWRSCGNAVLMALMWFGGRAMRFPLADCKAMIFTGASKTVTITLATLAILGVGEGLAVVPCLVFYFVQMIVDSMLAARMGAIGKS